MGWNEEVSPLNVRLDGIARTFGRRAVLHDVSFTLQPGITGLLGQNGAGKSTMLKILATVLPPTRGQVRYGDWLLPRDASRIRARLGYLPQMYGLYDQLSGLEFLTYAAVMKGIEPWSRARAHAADLVEAVGLESAAGNRLGTYSGGMRQRIALAQSLIGSPDLLILDEPSTGFDPEERTRMLNLVSLRAQTASVLLSTHVVSDLEQIATKIIVLVGGRIVAEGSPEEITAHALGLTFEVDMPAAEWAALAPSWTARHRAEGIPLVTHVQSGGESVRLRVVAADPPESGGRRVVHEVPPTLSDGYLALTSGLGHRDRLDA